MIEEWRDIVGYEGLYQISNLGMIKSLKKIKLNKGLYPFEQKEMVLKPGLNDKGYLIVVLTINKKRKTYSVHQLVAMSFLNHTPCKHKLVVNHINFIKTDNRIENLEIVTNRENCNLKHIKHSSNYTGVSWNKADNKWLSFIKIKGKSKYLGRFINEEEASKAYENAYKALNC